jgi:hypothetical protein
MMSDLNCKESEGQGNNQEFIEKMLLKCEVTSYTDLYTKLVASKGDLVRCEDIFSDNPAYTIEKIMCDVQPIANVIYLELFDPRANVQKSGQDQLFKKIPYLMNEKGLTRVLQKYRTENYLPKTIKWSHLLKLWNVQKEEEQKLLEMMKNLIQTKDIQAELIENPDLTVNFFAIMEIPEKRNKVFQLLGVILIFVSLLIGLILLVQEYDAIP